MRFFEPLNSPLSLVHCAFVSPLQSALQPSSQRIFLMSAAAIIAATATVAAAVKPARRKLFTLVLLAEPKPNVIPTAAVAAPALPCPLAPLSPSAAAVSLSSSPYARLLLGLKKRGFGQGKWNGFGGKLDEGESPRQAAIREMKEESDVESVRTFSLQVLLSWPILRSCICRSLSFCPPLLVCACLLQFGSCDSVEARRDLTRIR